jgi:uncharacterized membrane protein
MFGLGIPELIISLIEAVIFIGIPITLIIFFIRRGHHRSVSPSDGDTTDQIRKLGELRSQGYLSEEEFQRKKAELLSRL